jgi:hypothetical protein
MIVWSEVTTEDLIATLANATALDETVLGAAAEYERRCRQPAGQWLPIGLRAELERELHRPLVLVADSGSRLASKQCSRESVGSNPERCRLGAGHAGPCSMPALVAANARLIASAPDLLDLLAEASDPADGIACLSKPGLPAGTPEGCDCWACAWADRARAAVAKARGTP